MRKLYVLLLLLPLTLSAQNSVKIQKDAEPVKYNKMIFGHFIEHFHTQVYGGIYDPDSRFETVLFAGVGAAMPLHSKNHNMKTTYTAAFGLKANVRVTDRINVYAEPRGIFYGDKIDGYKSNAGFDATGMVLVGVDYKF